MHRLLLCDCDHTVCNVVFVLIETLPVHSKELFVFLQRKEAASQLWRLRPWLDWSAESSQETQASWSWAV